MTQCSLLSGRGRRGGAAPLDTRVSPAAVPCIIDRLITIELYHDS